ncbi:MAG: hypothetical protein IID43_04480 [Planctomycetes bacterium]|nr:hypothetical protein [Planctomycetota bacterium]
MIDTDRLEGPRAKGVLRLLDEGHFRGVADVRLRINFFDELSAGATRQAQAAVGDASSELRGEINRSVDELLTAIGTDDENAALIGEAIQTFEASLAEAVSAFQSSDAPSTETLATEIQTAFDTLLATLTTTLLPSDQAPVTPPPTDADEAPNAVVASPADDGVGAGTDDAASSPKSDDGAGSLRASTTDRVSLVASADSTIDQREVAAIDTEPDGLSDPAVTPSSDADAPTDAPVVSDETTRLDALIAAFVETFELALSSMLSTITETQNLADPSPPSGNGSAYEKFLAIYNDLRGQTDTLNDVA